MQPARFPVPRGGELPHRTDGRGSEWAWWIGVQLVLSALLTAALVVAFVMFLNPRTSLALPGSWRLPARWLLGLGAAGFLLRTLFLAARFREAPPRR
jgi:hypothetical protein